MNGREKEVPAQTTCATTIFLRTHEVHQFPDRRHPFVARSSHSRAGFIPSTIKPALNPAGSSPGDSPWLELRVPSSLDIHSQRRALPSTRRFTSKLDPALAVLRALYYEHFSHFSPSTPYSLCSGLNAPVTISSPFTSVSHYRKENRE